MGEKKALRTDFLSVEATGMNGRSVGLESWAENGAVGVPAGLCWQRPSEVIARSIYHGMVLSNSACAPNLYYPFNSHSKSGVFLHSISSETLSTKLRLKSSSLVQKVNECLNKGHSARGVFDNSTWAGLSLMAPCHSFMKSQKENGLSSVLCNFSYFGKNFPIWTLARNEQWQLQPKCGSI